MYDGRSDIAHHLLERKGARLDVSPFFVAHSPSIPLLQLLFDHGWDTIQRRENNAIIDQCLLQHVCCDESLVHWCLDHGAIVEDEQPDPYKNLPLLEIVAGVSTVDIFKLLRSRGAQLGPRTLHQAVEAAAAISDDNERLPVRMAMVKYLVDELGLDVNAMDTETQKPNH